MRRRLPLIRINNKNNNNKNKGGGQQELGLLWRMMMIHTKRFKSSPSYKSLINEIPLCDIRNFCILAHVDHGKSSLASRILELVGNFELGPSNFNDEMYLPSYLQPQQPITITTHDTTAATSDVNSHNNNKKENFWMLDTLQVEQERGITVKSSAASFLMPSKVAQNKHKLLLMNLIDTPGHVDFGFEVTRTLQAVQGAVLLFDASRGVQAQSLSVYGKAMSYFGNKQANIIPALSKIDLKHAKPLETSITVSELFGFDPDTILHTSARLNVGIQDLLQKIAEDLPPPQPLLDDDYDANDIMVSNKSVLRVQIVDSWFEPLRGVVCLIQVLSGEMDEGDRLCVLHSSSFHDSVSTTTAVSSADSNRNSMNFSVQEIGMVFPHRIRTQKLRRGQMGYAVVGLRDPRECMPGNLLVQKDSYIKVQSMEIPEKLKNPPIKKAEHSVLYASVHPYDADEFDELCSAVDRLALNDTGLEVHRASGASNSNNDGGPFLGPGLRIGFQGLLHVEVFRQRLLDEFDMDAIVTQPKVSYTIKYLSSSKYKRAADAPTEEVIEDVSKWPKHGSQRYDVYEPIVRVRVISPMDYAGSIMELMKRKRGFNLESSPIDDMNWMFIADMPWGEVVTDFHDVLKNNTQGYASFDISEAQESLKKADLVKVDIVLNGDIVDPLSFVCHRDRAQAEGRVVCKKLQEVLERQQFVITIQAKANNKIIASEKIKAYRKDVLSIGGGKTVGGGDISRKKKLLDKQKKGKKMQQLSGKVSLSQAAFNSVITRS